MTDSKDRLIELLKNSPYLDTLDGEFGKAADHLIANGVIVPPCKVGDMVYVIEPCSCFNGYRTFEECHKRRTNATKWIEAVMVANRRHNRCMKLFERPFKMDYFNKIGKTVFLTKEEAEKKLKELNDNATTN